MAENNAEDCRFHKFGEILSAAKTPEIIELSNERSLYIKIMSLHETNRTLKNYFDTIERK